MNGPDNLLPSPIQAAPLPEVRNHTRFPSQYFQMLDTVDTLFHVMVTRITYDLTQLDADGYPRLASKQTELVTSDEFINAPNVSSTLQESDFAPYKPKCDLLFINAVAYAPTHVGVTNVGAPTRKPTARFPAGVRVELNDHTTWQKLLTVTGPRTLGAGLLGGLTLSEPEPAEQVAISYELAFGGTNTWWKGWPTPAEDDQRLDIDLHDHFNPIGCGLIDPQWQRKVGLNQFPAPQIEAFEYPFTRDHAEAGARAAGSPDAMPAYPAVGLGPIGRWWQPRRSKAGSYDEIWKATRWPKLPQDFDFGYWNAAPEDQQIDYPQGGEKFMLVNLIAPEHAADGCMVFRLPPNQLHQRVRLHSGPRITSIVPIDTVIVDLQSMTLTLVHRITTPTNAAVRVIEIGLGDGRTAAADANATHLADEMELGAARGQ